MPEARTLDQAIQLLLIPSSVRAIRASPLPKDADFLLRILARDPDAESEAIELSGKPIETIHEAAEFYADQILFVSQATAYRVLATEPGATRDVLRAHMGLLMRWLHPDSGIEAHRIDHFDRVARAWDILRSNRRREAYDRQLLSAAAPRSHAVSVKRSSGVVLFQTSQSPRQNRKMQKRMRGAGRLRRFVGLAAISMVLFLIWVALAQPAWLDSVLKIGWLVGDRNHSPSMALGDAALERTDAVVRESWKAS